MSTRRTLLLAFVAIVAASFVAFPAIASAANALAPGAMLTSNPADEVDANTATQATAPAAPTGVAINRPTVPMDQYRAAKAAAGAFSQMVAKDGLPVSAPTAPIALTGTWPLTDQASSDGWSPPDVNGAVGLKNIVHVTNDRYIVYTKPKSGAPMVKLNESLNTLCSYSGASLFDPRVEYDPQWQRYIVTAVGFAESPTVQILCIMVSQTSNPAGGFWRYLVDVDIFNNNDFWDYPQLGLQQDAVLFTSNIFPAAGGFSGADMLAVSKSILYNGLGFSVPIFTGLAATLTPPEVIDQNPTAFMLARGNNTTQLGKVSFTNPGNGFYASATSGTYTVPTWGVPANAPQPGTSSLIDTSDARFINDPTQIGTSLYAVHTLALGSFSAPKWYQLNTTSNTVTQSSFFFQNGSSFDYNASIVARPDGSAYTTWSASYSAENPSILVASHKPSDAANVMGPGLLAFTSPTNLTGNFDPNFGAQRWGDTSSVEDDGTYLYAFNQTAVDTNHWGTRFVKFK